LLPLKAWITAHSAVIWLSHHILVGFTRLALLKRRTNHRWFVTMV